MSLEHPDPPLVSPFPPIADYGFLSDCETCALVAPSGAIEWMCLPRFDGPSCSARCWIATRARSGSARPTRWSPPRAATCPGTMILETSWGTRQGWLIVRDVLLIGPWHDTDERSSTHRRAPTDYDADHVLLRTIRCVNGSVEVHLECDPIFDYGRRYAHWEYVGDGYSEVGRRAPTGWPTKLTLTTDLRVGFEGSRVRAVSTLTTATRRSSRSRSPSIPAPRPTPRRTSGSSRPPTTGTPGSPTARSPTTRGASTCSARRSR